VQSYNADVIGLLNINQDMLQAQSAGVEIELDYGAEVYRRGGDSRTGRLIEAGTIVQEARQKLLQFGVEAVPKWDGTIGDGFELATEPIPFDALVNVANAYGELLTIGKASAACGLHVHISRRAFGTNRAFMSWVWLWSRHVPVLILSGRTESRLLQWADPRKTYPVYEHERLAAVPDDPPSMLKDPEHHSSVCLRRARTAELRVFAAPRSRAIAQERLELTVATVQYCVACARTRTDVSWANFFEWLHDSEYKHALAYVRRRLRTKAARRMPYNTAFTVTFDTAYYLSFFAKYDAECIRAIRGYEGAAILATRREEREWYTSYNSNDEDSDDEDSDESGGDVYSAESDRDEHDDFL
jgi:hypothetical protein